VYRNTCEMRRATCGQGVVAADNRETTNPMLATIM
jgi:hypothetical protein